jgi:hypothetical protein
VFDTEDDRLTAGPLSVYRTAPEPAKQLKAGLRLPPILAPVFGGAGPAAASLCGGTARTDRATVGGHRRKRTATERMGAVWHGLDYL